MSMEAFSIEFTGERETVEDAGTKLPLARIAVGMFEEQFPVPVIYWSPDDYRRQWREGVRRIVEGDSKSGLITALSDPSTARFIEWWPLFRDADAVFVQNHLLFLETLREPFDPNHPYSHVRDRRVVDDEGNDISEWQTTVEALRRFLDDADSTS